MSDSQPPPFGCRLVAVAAIASFIFGVAGAGLGNQLFEDDNGSPAAQRQQLTVSEDTASTEAAKKVSPTVVSITSTQQTETFFGPIESKAGGTGFIITNDGLVATNKHVVAGSPTSLTVVTGDGKNYPAKVAATDPLLDFALVKIEADNLPVVELGNSDELQAGQRVIAIGNALGELDNTVTEGVISAKERTINAGEDTAERLEGLLQTDAAINPGNSGGPLVNMAGQVIGVNTAIAGGSAQGIGFAIAINQVKQAISAFQKDGKISRGFLGVNAVPITAEEASARKLAKAGALIQSSAGIPGVVAGSAAARGGLREGDLITAVNGESVDDDHGLSFLIGKYPPGTEIELTFYRGGQEQKVRVTLGER